MKALVGLACVAVVAFVGYFFWGEWRASQRAQQVASARAELVVKQAEATQRLASINEVGQDVATLCQRVSGWYAESEDGKRTFANFMVDCRILGHVS